MDVIDEVLPTGVAEWQNVTDKHNQEGIYQRWAVRTLDAIKQKFMRTVNTTKPTGHSTQTPPVTRALQIHDRILMKAAVASSQGLSDGGSDVDENDENEEPMSAQPPGTPSPSRPLATPRVSPNAAADSSNTEMRQVLKRRSRIDSAMNSLAQAVVSRNTGPSLVDQMLLMEAKREEREERQKRDLQEKEDAREAKRQEREDRQHQQFMMMLAAISGRLPAAAAPPSAPTAPVTSVFLAFSAPR